jgi:hypothetical protein
MQPRLKLLPLLAGLAMIAAGVWCLSVAIAGGQCPGGSCPTLGSPITSYQSAPRSSARPVPAQGHRAAVVEVIATNGLGRTAGGSGVLVRWGGRTVGLTACHVVKDARRVHIKLSDRRTLPCVVLLRETTWDFAVLDPQERDLPSVEVRRRYEPLEPGERLEACGFGSTGTLSAIAGGFLDYTGPSAAAEGDWLRMSGAARAGDSGGPIFGADGAVEGILWGTDGRQIVGVQAGLLYTRMTAALGPNEAAPKTLPAAAVAQTDCDCADPASCLAKGKLLGGLGKRRAPTSPPQINVPEPKVIVQDDPAIRGSLGRIEQGVGAVAQNTAPPPPKDDGPLPWLVIVLIVAALGFGVLVFYVVGKN